MSDSHTRPPQIFEPAYYARLDAIEAGHWWQRGMRRAMMAILTPYSGEEKITGSVILDAGCGAGFLLESLSKDLPGNVVHGFDFALPALVYCRRRGLEQTIQADAVAPPYASGRFDLVLCIDTIQHLSPAGADHKAIAEFFRILNPGGVLFIRTNSALGHLPLRGVDPDLYRRYRKPELVRAFRRAGFGNIRASYLNMLPSAWGFLKEALSGETKDARPEGPGLAIDLPKNNLLAKILEMELGLEARLIQLGLELPFGHSIGIAGRKPRVEVS